MSSQEDRVNATDEETSAWFPGIPKVVFNTWSLEMRGDIGMDKLMPDLMEQKIPKDFQVHRYRVWICINLQIGLLLWQVGVTWTDRTYAVCIHCHPRVWMENKRRCRNGK